MPDAVVGWLAVRVGVALALEVRLVHVLLPLLRVFLHERCQPRELVVPVLPQQTVQPRYIVGVELFVSDGHHLAPLPCARARGRVQALGDAYHATQRPWLHVVVLLLLGDDARGVEELHLRPDCREHLHLVLLHDLPRPRPERCKEGVPGDLALRKGVCEHVPGVDPAQLPDAACEQVLLERLDLVEHLLLRGAFRALVRDRCEHRHGIHVQHDLDVELARLQPATQFSCRRGPVEDLLEEASQKHALLCGFAEIVHLCRERAPANPRLLPRPEVDRQEAVVQGATKACEQTPESQTVGISSLEGAIPGNSQYRLAPDPVVLDAALLLLEPLQELIEVVHVAAARRRVGIAAPLQVANEDQAIGAAHCHPGHATAQAHELLVDVLGHLFLLLECPQSWVHYRAQLGQVVVLAALDVVEVMR
eukprot:207521-Pyramimonas_sp.AAC.1